MSVGAASGEQLGEATEASTALASALRQERLTILGLGPGTNVAPCCSSTLSWPTRSSKSWPWLAVVPDRVL